MVGRGTPWARYEPHFENVSAGQVKQAEASEDGAAPAVDMPGKWTRWRRRGCRRPSRRRCRPRMRMAPKGRKMTVCKSPMTRNPEVVTYEEVCWDYVHWRDFRTAIPRVAGSGGLAVLR